MQSAQSTVLPAKPARSGLRIIGKYVALLALAVPFVVFPTAGEIIGPYLVPLWVTGVGNVMLMSLALNALGGGIDHRWLQLPAVVSGLWLVAWAFTHWQALQEANAFDTQNRLSAPLHESDRALYLWGNVEEGAQLAAEIMTAIPDIRVFGDGIEYQHVRDDRCKETFKRASRARSRITGNTTTDYRYTQVGDGSCIVPVRSDVPPSVIAIRIGSMFREHGPLGSSLKQFWIARATEGNDIESLGTVSMARFTYLSPFPGLGVDCFPGERQRPGEECRLEPLKFRVFVESLGDQELTPGGYLARALGLPIRKEETR